MSLFRLVNRKGFQMEFDNGLTVSVMFGEGNYCERRHSTSMYKALTGGENELRKLILDPWESKNAGVAVWRTSDSQWASIARYGDENRWSGDPVGYVSPDLVARIIAYVGHPDTYMTDRGRLSQKGSTDVLDVSKWEGEE